MSPFASANPLRRASPCPSSASLTQYDIDDWCLWMISTVRSVDPPSITMYSTCGYVCPATLRIVCSMNASLLNDGVTMLTSGRPAPAREPRRSKRPSSAVGRPSVERAGDASPL